MIDMFIILIEVMFLQVYVGVNVVKLLDLNMCSLQCSILKLDFNKGVKYVNIAIIRDEGNKQSQIFFFLKVVLYGGLKFKRDFQISIFKVLVCKLLLVYNDRRNLYFFKYVVQFS